MNKKILIVSLILAGVLVVNQAEAANFFQKMFKRNASTTQVTSINSGKLLNNDCIVKAIDKREAAIGSAYSTMTKAISAALTTRADALSASWAQTDRNTRLASRNVAWKAFNDTTKASRQIYKTGTQSAWALYKNDAKTCKVDVVGVEPENREADL